MTEQMTPYKKALILIQQLSLEEQLQLLAELSQSVRQTIRSLFVPAARPTKRLGLDRWRGFLPRRVDPIAFQNQLRDEWE